MPLSLLSSVRVTPCISSSSNNSCGMIFATYRSARVLFSQLVQRELRRRRRDCHDNSTLRTHHSGQQVPVVRVQSRMLGRRASAPGSTLLWPTSLRHLHPGQHDAPAAAVPEGPLRLPGGRLHLSERLMR